jgi:hypothetical protein
VGAGYLGQHAKPSTGNRAISSLPDVADRAYLKISFPRQLLCIDLIIKGISRNQKSMLNKKGINPKAKR